MIGRGLLDAFKCAGEVGAGYTHFLLVIVECESGGGVVFGVVVYTAQLNGTGLVAVVGVGLDLVFKFIVPCGLRGGVSVCDGEAATFAKC